MMMICKYRFMVNDILCFMLNVVYYVFKLNLNLYDNCKMICLLNMCLIIFI